MNSLKRKGFLFFIFYLTLTIVIVYSQKIVELKEKKNAIEKEIEEITSLISKTENESKNSLLNIKLTKRKIELKNNLIKQIDKESEQIGRLIDFQKGKIDSLEYSKNLIKNDYKKLIAYTQKTKGKTSLLLLILSSRDFNQAYKRIKFYQQVLKYKTQVTEKYNKTINSIMNENTKLNENVSSLNKKQNKKTLELNELKNEELLFKKKINSLSKKKIELLEELEKQKKVTKRISEEINRLIAEEAKRVLENTKTISKNNQIALSNNFKDNLGKFNLPVNKGIISGSYGVTFHPILKEIKIKNNGVDITLSQKSDVYSIYKGEIRSVFKIPGSSLGVIIRHGGYLSVYANLSTVNVSVGQEIVSYQKIGEITLQKGEETAILHFELWNENKTEDPSRWFKSN